VQVKQRAWIFCKSLALLVRICIASGITGRPTSPERLHSVSYSIPLTNTFDKLLRLLEKAGIAESEPLCAV
jgi:hypothetical protein